MKKKLVKKILGREKLHIISPKICYPLYAYDIFSNILGIPCINLT